MLIFLPKKTRKPTTRRKSSPRDYSNRNAHCFKNFNTTNTTNSGTSPEDNSSKMTAVLAMTKNRRKVSKLRTKQFTERGKAMRILWLLSKNCRSQCIQRGQLRFGTSKFYRSTNMQPHRVKLLLEKKSVYRNHERFRKVLRVWKLLYIESTKIGQLNWLTLSKLNAAVKNVLIAVDLLWRYLCVEHLKS